MAATGQGAQPSRREELTAWLERPTTVARLAVGAPLALLAIGLVMVFSASSIGSYAEHNSSYTEVIKQGTFAGLGLAGAALLALLPVAWLKRLALPGMLAAMVLQGLVFSPLGVAAKGNRNWVLIGGQTLQPSELLKLGLVLGGAVVLARKLPRLRELAHLMVPFAVPIVLVCLGLVLAGRDLGSALVLVAIALGMTWVAGVSLVWLGSGIALAVALAVVLAVTSANRMGRIMVWLNDCSSAQEASCYQKVHGEYALADGGWWGVGLGASREKWFYLPEPHNDFIFAVIGEELGMMGACLVMALFGVIAYVCYRIIAGTTDPFVRIATGGIMAWLLGQAMINIGSVIGLLPIIGVPLPYVSSGGSALVSALAAAGVLVAFARDQVRSARPARARQSARRVPARSTGRPARSGRGRRAGAGRPPRARRVPAARGRS